MDTPQVQAVAVESVSPDEQAVIAEFIAFLKDASAKRHPAGTIQRFNQGRHSGCVQAEFTVPDDLPPDLRVGLFSVPRTYPAWIRFANAASQSDQKKDVRGMSISLSDVSGKNLTPGVTKQDFVLNSHPVMVAANTRDFLDLLRALEGSAVRRILYIVSHVPTVRRGLASRANPTSHLDIWYWSTTPYLFGEGRAVKYAVRPCSPTRSTLPAQLTKTYLRDAMRSHLDKAEACFDFLVQVQKDSRTTPIEDATVEWKEEDSAYRQVARIRIPRQNIEEPGRMNLCEETAFNPWHSLSEHRPLGSLNRARREIYRAMAEFRRQRQTR
ncbi:MAG: catalase family protein [Gemmatimonadota bacterium]